MMLTETQRACTDLLEGSRTHLRRMKPALEW